MALIDDIEAYYKFQSNSNDATPNANNGTDTDITYSSTAPIVIGEYAVFNNLSSKITEPSGVYSLFSSTNVWSINVWVYPNVTLTALEHCIFAVNTNAGNFQHKTDLQIGGGATIDLVRRSSGGALSQISGGTALSLNTWYMVTATYDGSNLRIYLNGTSDATPVADTNTADIYQRGDIGATIESGSNSKWWGGRMDEMGFWSRALSGAEITQLYNSGAALQYPFSVGPTNLKTFNGLATGSIKTIEALAIANVKTVNGLG